MFQFTLPPVEKGHRDKTLLEFFFLNKACATLKNIKKILKKWNRLNSGIGMTWGGAKKSLQFIKTGNSKKQMLAVPIKALSKGEEVLASELQTSGPVGKALDLMLQ